jgi:hypothetical protein
MEISGGSASAEGLIQRFKELVKFAENQILPYHPPRIFKIPERSGRMSWRAVLVKLVFPLPLINSDERLDFYLFTAWIVQLVGAVVLFVGGATYVLEPPAPSGLTADNVNWFGVFVLAILVLLGAALFPFAYTHLVKFFFDPKIQAKDKLFWLAVLAGFLVWRAMGMQAVDLRAAAAEMSPSQTGWMLVLVFGALIPVLIHLTSSLVYFLELIFQLLSLLARYFLRLNSPHTYVKMSDLVTGPVQGVGGVWRMGELGTFELRALREWSIQNRDGTEKRILPTTFVLAVAGLLAASEGVRQWVSDWLIYFLSQFSGLVDREITAADFGLPMRQFGILLVGMVLVGVVLFFFMMFRNLLVQTYLVEACTVALYAAETREREAAQSAAAAVAAARERAGGLRGWLRRWFR